MKEFSFKLVFICSVLLYFIQCKEKQKDNYSKLIQQDWMTLYEDAVISNPEGIYFDSTHFHTFEDVGVFRHGKFVLNQDTLEINAVTHKGKYLIKKLTDDSLWLKALEQRSIGEHVEKYYNRKLEFNPNLKIDSILIETRYCHGCKEYNMKYSNGEIQYYENENNKKRFQLSKDKENKIDSLIQWSYLDKVNAFKFGHWNHEWRMDVTFYLKNHKPIKVNGAYGSFSYRFNEIIETLVSDIPLKDITIE